MTSTTEHPEPAAERQTAPVDELHPDGLERPSEAAMRLADDEPAAPPAKRDRKRSSTKPRPEAKPARKRSSTSTTAKPERRVSGRQALEKVLADGKPAKVGDITAAAVKLVRPPMKGKTPQATLSAQLYTQAKRPDGLVVRTKNPGEFKLNPKRATS